MKTRESSSRSIRQQLEVSVTLAVALLFAIGALGVYLFVRADVNRQFLDKLERHLEAYADELEMDVEGEVDANFHELVMAGYDPAESAGEDDGREEDEDEEEDEEDGDDEDVFEDVFEDAVSYVLRDFEGATILASPWLKGVEASLRFEPNSEEHVVVFGQAEPVDGVHLRTASMSFQLPLEVLDPDEVGVVDTSATENYNAAAPESRVHLVIAESDGEIRHLLAVLALALAATGIAITGATALLISRLIRRACRPIEKMSEFTASIDPGHLSSRLPEDRAPAELEPLVHQFNALLERVERAFSRERRFSADIAHELRTPVAELRSLAEVALTPSERGEECSEDPEEVYRETAAISKRMGHLIEVLSDLHRAESTAGGIDRKPVSITKILNQAVSSALPAAEERELSIDFPNGSNVEATTDPVLLRGIFDNLLGNAVTYSKRGHPIVCEVARASNGEGVSVEIRNATDQLRSDDLSHLHEPFWQKDAARSKASHFGLGLSTVAAYAKLLEIKVDYRLDDGNFIAGVNFPATP